MKYFANKFNQINKKIAITSVTGMSTMICVYAFLIWSIIPLVFPATEQFVAYISADIIQLVALPLIMVGQKVMGDASQARHSKISEKHEELSDSISELKAMRTMNDEELSLLHTIAIGQQEILENQMLIMEKYNISKNT